jgi:hypothetical protein
MSLHDAPTIQSKDEAIELLNHQTELFKKTHNVDGDELVEVLNEIEAISDRVHDYIVDNVDEDDEAEENE